MFINSHGRSVRASLAALIVLILGIGACQLPTEYSAEVGQRISFSLAPADKSFEAVNALIGRTQEILEFIRGRDGVDDVSVNIRESADEGAVGVDVVAWGQGLSSKALSSELKTAFPMLAEADVRTEGVGGTVKGTVKDRLLHDCLKIELKNGSVEEMRADIVRQLAEQGFTGKIDVQSAQDAFTITMEWVQEVDGEREQNMSLRMFMTDDEFDRAMADPDADGAIKLEDARSICIEICPVDDDN